MYFSYDICKQNLVGINHKRIHNIQSSVLDKRKMMPILELLCTTIFQDFFVSLV